MEGDIALIFAAGGWVTHIAELSAKTRQNLPGRLAVGLQNRFGQGAIRLPGATQKLLDLFNQRKYKEEEMCIKKGD